MKTCIRTLSGLLLCGLLLATAGLSAAQDTVFVVSVDSPLAEVYPALSRSFENSRFFVVNEIDIGKNLSRFAKKWGEDYNRNGLGGIRSMVFCNGWYANRVSNLDPNMLGLCPLHLTLYEKGGRTTVVFNRPTSIAVGSPAHDLLAEIEQEVIEIIKKGLP